MLIFRRSPLLLSALGLLAFGASCGDDSGEGGASSSSSGQGATVSNASTGATGTGGSGGAGDGLRIPGLSAPVTAVTDPNGLLHLECATDNDCYAALGYFHASNRFFFMDFVRNFVRGSLASLVKAGDTVLAQDYVNRQFFATRDGTPLEEKLYDDASDLVKGHLDAYTTGVNAWIGDMRNAKNGATLTTEYDFPLIEKAGIRDWEAKDCAAIGIYVLNDLSNNSEAELTLATQYPEFDPALAADLYSTRPVFDAFTVPAANANFAPFTGISEDALARLDSMKPLSRDAANFIAHVGSGGRNVGGEIGSNNWTVGPGRTTNGFPLLANDPHLLLTNPSIWFGVELDAKSAGQGQYHVAGSTFPGLPSVMVGHNESIGWGVTTAYYDLADEYLETLTPDHASVIFQGNPVAIVEKTFDFKDASTGDVLHKTFRWVPHHGPIVSEDDTNNTAVTVRWTAHDGGTDLDAFFSLARAGSVDEAKDGLHAASSANQNFVVIDKGGSIGWFPYAHVPNRPWASPALPPWLPLPGDGSAEWAGDVPIADLPQLENPPAGAIATANADLTGASADGDITNDGQAALQAWDKADGTREQRILDLLADGGNAHTVETMQAMQGDTYSLFGNVVVPAVLAAASSATLTPGEQDVIDALQAWQLTCPTGLDETDPLADPATAAKSTDAAESAESIGCTAFHTTLYAIVNAALGDEEAVAGLDPDSTRVDLELVVRAIKDPTSLGSGDLLWDDVTTTDIVETRDEILLRGVTDAAAILSSGMGAKDEWRWGRVHTLSLRSIYDNFGITTYNEGPYMAPGGQFTVNVGNPVTRLAPASGDAPDFAFKAGPSVRFVVEARDDGLTMSYELPGGQDLHRESPFFDSLLPNWLVNKPIDFPFGPGAVTAPYATVVVKP